MKVTSRPWIVHLAIAAGLGALVWLGDRATGSHLAKSLNTLALNLAVWYEERRIPTVLCGPKTPVPYTRLEGVSFEVPQCWHAESTSLFDREVHRFFDPDARAGVVSVSLDPIVSEEDRQALRAEFEQLASRPSARIDDEAADGSADTTADAGRRIHSAADSLAERFMHDAGGAAHSAEKPAGPFTSVETVGVIGASDQTSPELSGERFATRPSEGTGPRRAWSWLLISDGEAVRVVYTVRDDWVGEPAITGELKRVRTMVRSLKPRP